MTEETKPAAMKEDHLDAVVGGGPSQSRCEHDDGGGTGGSSVGRRTQINDLTSYIDASN